MPSRSGDADADAGGLQAEDAPVRRPPSAVSALARDAASGAQRLSGGAAEDAQNTSADIPKPTSGGAADDKQAVAPPAVPQVPTLMDTLPALLYAAHSTTGLLDERLRRDLAAATPEGAAVVAQVRARLDNTTFTDAAGRETAAADLSVFAGELDKILAHAATRAASWRDAERLSRRWLPYVHALMYAGAALVLGGSGPEGVLGACADAYVHVYMQELLPTAGQFWVAANVDAPSLFPPGKPGGDWLESLWGVLRHYLAAEPPGDDGGFVVLRGERVGAGVRLLARLMRMFLPWADGDVPAVGVFERHGFEVRAEPVFASAIRAGLGAGAEPIVKREALYALKQAVRFDALYMHPEPARDGAAASGRPAASELVWPSRLRGQYSAAWRAFVLVYEALGESEVHLVAPVLPSLDDVFCGLPGRWWPVLAERAGASDSAAVRRAFVLAVLRASPGALAAVRAVPAFAYGALLPLVDAPWLYVPGGEAYAVGEAGMAVASFYGGLLGGFAPGDAQAAAVRDYLSWLSGVRNASAMVFLLQALLSLPKDNRPLTGSLSGASAAPAMAAIAASASSVLCNVRARRLARWQLLAALVRHGACATFSFDELARLLEVLLVDVPAVQGTLLGQTEIGSGDAKGSGGQSGVAGSTDKSGTDKNGTEKSTTDKNTTDKTTTANSGVQLAQMTLTVDCVEHAEVRAWLADGCGRDYVVRSVAAAIDAYLQGAPDALSAPALAVVLTLVLAPDAGVAEGSAFAAASAPLQRALAAMAAADPGRAPGRVLLLLQAVHDAVGSATAGRVSFLASLDTGSRLFEWVSVAVDLLLPAAAGSSAQAPGAETGADPSGGATAAQTASGTASGTAADPTTAATAESQPTADSGQSTNSTTAPLSQTDEIALAGTLRLLLQQAVGQRDALVAYLDMVLYRVVALLGAAAAQQAADAAEDYAAQRAKVSTLAVMDASLAALDAAGSHHLGFLAGGDVVAAIFGMRLERTPDVPDADAWLELGAAFAAAKWGLVGTLARFSVRAIELRDKISAADLFRQCGAALGDAAFRSVLGVLRAMQTILSLDAPESRVPAEDVARAMDTARALAAEQCTSPAWHFLYVAAAIDAFVQPAVLLRPDLDAAVAAFVAWVVGPDVGARRRNVVTRLAANVRAFAEMAHDASLPEERRAAVRARRKTLRPALRALAVFGAALPDAPDDRAVLGLAVHNAAEATGAKRTAVVDALARGSDYLVRVHADCVLLHLDPLAEDDRALALELVDDLLADLK